MLHESRHGALAVIEEAPAKDEIQRALRGLDERLFLEKQVTLANEIVWCVVVNVGSAVPPITILEWRDESNRPIPHLAWRLVQRVEQMDRSADKLRERVIEENARKIEADRKIADHAYEEIGRDAQKMSAGHSALLPRGQYLRMARDRMRAQGRKI